MDDKELKRWKDKITISNKNSKTDKKSEKKE